MQSDVCISAFFFLLTFFWLRPHLKINPKGKNLEWIRWSVMYLSVHFCVYIFQWPSPERLITLNEKRGLKAWPKGSGHQK